MTQKFVTAFLTTCFEMGISKEAASQLLQQESVDRELSARPAFAAGYLAKAAAFPGQLRAILIPHSSEMEKAAWGPGMRAVGNLGKALLWTAPTEAAKAGWGAIRSAGRAVGATVGPSKVKPSLLTRHPFAVGVGGMGLASAGTYGLNKWWNLDNDLTGGQRADAFLPPGGFSEQEYERMYKNRLAEHEPGIFATNRDRAGSAGSIASLERAIAENRAGAHGYRDLEDQKRQHSRLTGASTDYVDQLDMDRNQNRQLMDRIANRKADLENQRTAWWAAPRRWAAAAREGDWRGPLADSTTTQRGMDKLIAPLQENHARAQLQQRLATDRSALLRGGATGRTAPSRSPQQMTRDFFPTY